MVRRSLSSCRRPHHAAKLLNLAIFFMSLLENGADVSCQFCRKKRPRLALICSRLANVNLAAIGVHAYLHAGTIRE